MARLRVTTGGVTRQDSVRAGLCVLPADIGLVLVHGAARPLVDRATIERCLDAHRCGAAIAAVPVADTLKQVDPDGRIIRTVDRSGLWQAQTPQGARRDLLERAYAEADRSGRIATDEAALLGRPVSRSPWSRAAAASLKITRPDDLQVAAAPLGGNAHENRSRFRRPPAGRRPQR